MNRQLIISTLVAVISAAILGAALAPPALAVEAKPPELTYDPGMAAGTFRGKATRLPQPNQVDPGGGGGCWGAQTTRSKGLWPANRAIHMYTVWCSANYKITYRQSTVWTNTDPICWTESGPHKALVSGGAGWSWAEVQAWAGFACHTPWWFDIHETLVQRIKYHWNGWYETTYWE